MSLVSQIEELGAAVDGGLLNRGDAVQRLVEYSEGGLTHCGAAEQIRNWQTSRARYADEMMRAEMGLAAVKSALRRSGGES